MPRFGWQRDRAPVHLLGARLERTGAARMTNETLVQFCAPAPESPPGCVAFEQGDTEGCVAQAIARAADVFLRSKGIVLPLVSRRGLYAEGRRAMGQRPLLDDGCEPALAILRLARDGVTDETRLPFDNRGANNGGNVNDEIPLDAIEDAATHLVTGLERIKGSGDARALEICSVIDSGFPVVNGFDLDQPFVDLAPGAVWPGLRGPRIGGHYLTHVGYDRALRALITINSWGRFCSNGFCLVSFDAVGDTMHSSDAYALMAAPANEGRAS